MEDDKKRHMMETLEMFMKAQNRDYYFKGVGVSESKSNISIKHNGEEVK